HRVDRRLVRPLRARGGHRPHRARQRRAADRPGRLLGAGRSAGRPRRRPGRAAAGREAAGRGFPLRVHGEVIVRASLPLLLLLAGAPALAGGGTGWRGDGTGHFPHAPPPVGWSPDKVMWRTELPGWSNAAPVVVAGRVCAAIEPTTAFCADAATGRLLWKASNEVLDALPADQRAALQPKLLQADALDEELRQIK